MDKGSAKVSFYPDRWLMWHTPLQSAESYRGFFGFSLPALILHPSSLRLLPRLPDPTSLVEVVKKSF